MSVDLWELLFDAARNAFAIVGFCGLVGALGAVIVSRSRKARR